MSTDRRRIYIAVIVALVLLATAGAGTGIWLAVRSPAERTGQPEEVTIGISLTDASALAFIAEDRGYFADNGLDVAVRDCDSGAAAVRALLAGEVDVATTASFVVVKNGFDNPGLRILGITAQMDIVEVIARRDRGIEQPSDLAGKRIGLAMGSSAEFFISSFLVLNDLSILDVELVDISPPQMHGAIESGDVDAVVVWSPYSLDIKNAMGEEAVSWPAQGGREENFLLVTTDDWAGDHPDALEGLLKAMMDAEEFVSINEREAGEIVADRLGIDVSYVEKSWQRIEFALSLQQQMLLTMEDQAQWLIDSGLTGAAEVPNYLDFIHFDSLEKVKPEAVTVIHEED